MPAKRRHPVQKATENVSHYLVTDTPAKQINGYSSPKNLGHKEIDDLFNDVVLVQEKFDGSQISFGLRNGELFVRTRKRMVVDFEEKGIFKLAIEQMAPEFMVEGWTYRGECITKPKHNTLAYDRTPDGYIMLFDVDKGDQHYVGPLELIQIAREIGVEPASWHEFIEAGTKPTVEQLDEWNGLPSQLGGMREGIVLKSYDIFTRSGKTMQGKYVSAKFKEQHTTSWKNRNPGQNDIIENFGEIYRTEARWAKARQHLTEDGKLEGSMRDIPALMKEISSDVFQEHADEIRDALFKLAWKKISRKITHGMPEWYKQVLAEEQLGE